MKNKRIAAIVAIALTGSYIIPTNAINTKVTNKVVLTGNRRNNKGNGKNQQDNVGTKTLDDNIDLQNQSSVNNKDNQEILKNNQSENNLSVKNDNNKLNNRQLGKNKNLKESIGLAAENIYFYNIWGGDSVNLSFNTSTMKIEATRKSGDLGNGNNNYLKFVYYNSKDGETTSREVNDGSSSNLSNILNNKSFNYGDIIGIQFQEGTNAPKLNNGNKISSNGEMEYFKLTENGLVKYSPKVSVNPLQIITGDTIKTAIVSGIGVPNKEVTATINGQAFTGETNNSGDFSINIVDNNGFQENTKINLEIPSKVGDVFKSIEPTLAKGINIGKNEIVLNNVWNQSLGNITFNPATKTISFKNGWSLINPYLSESSEVFSISLYNNNGSLINSATIYGSEYPENQLSKLLNNQPYQYGDYIKIDYKTSSQIAITNFDGENSYKVNKPIILEITKDGLREANIKAVPINPVDILEGPVKVTEGVVTGKVNPNETVTATVDGKNFTAISNDEGIYSIKIEDSNGFTEKTKIQVNANGYLPNTATAVLNKGIKIGNSSIQVINGWGTPAGLLRFNPATLTFNVSQYNAYLGHNSNDFINITVSNPTTGKTVDSISLKGNDNTGKLISELSGKTFNYGNVITISYDSSQGKVNINNGTSSIGNSTGASESFKITKQGLEKDYIKEVPANPVDILKGVTKVTTGIITGKVSPNELVTGTIKGKIFSTKANSEGIYLLNINDKNGFNNDTKITLNAAGYIPRVIKPTLSSDIKINDTIIELSNNWRQNIGTIGFNANNQTINFNPGWAETNPYLGNKNESFAISLYNSDGTLLKTLEINGDTYPENSLENFFKNTSYQYGDYIELDYVNSTNIELSNNHGKTATFVTKPTIFEITESGLVKSNIARVEAKPLAILNGPGTKVTKGIITGKVRPNEIVTAIVNGKSFTTISNGEGNYSLEVEDSQGFTENTKIKLNANGYLTKYINPVINSDIKIENSNIIFIDNYGEQIGEIKFVPSTGKFKFINGGAEINPYLSAKSKAFTISLYNPQGKIQGTVTTYGSSFPQQTLSELFNNKSYEYGSYIKVTYENSTRISINGFNNQNNYQVKGTIIAKITKEGLVSSNISSIKVNTFGILSGGKITSGNVTGTAPANEEVIATVNGKTFTTKSNKDGKYSINILDSKGFNANTIITLWTSGQLAVQINPVAPINWGLNGTKLQLANQTLGMAQTLSLNPSSMTISNSGNAFSAQLIDGSTGKMIASEDNSNFNVSNSKNNLNGATFELGDILNIYESEETYLSDGNIKLYTDGKIESLESNNKFKSFKITKAGLVPVTNNNLNNVQALYNGNNQVVISGKTLPNIAVQINYDSKNQIIKSNSKGEFSLTVPLDDAAIGSEVRVFVNNDNNIATIVGYNPDKYNVNNSIQIENNESMPVINLTFSPITNTINSIVYPRDKTYAGVFYGNKMSISLLDGKSGKVIKSISSEKPGEIQSFSNQLNTVHYNNGDIIKVQYDNNLVSVNVFKDNKEIGNSTGTAEYFEITNKGLINVTDNFVKVNPLDILGNGNINKTIVTGNIKPNETITASVNGQQFTGKADSKGNFSLNIEDSKGFNSNTEITLDAEGYIPTTIKPTINSNISLVNSYVNFYKNSFNWEATSLCSSIGFNVSNNTFNVNNYDSDFGTGNSTYFTFNLYNQNGEKLLGQSFTGASTKALSEFLNGKSFNYGDIIELSYNPSIYKPVVVNGNDAIGNLTGSKEYFEITKEGLRKINFGNNALLKSNNWSDGNLNIEANLTLGNSEIVKNSSKKIVLMDSKGNIIASENASTIDKNGEVLVTGQLNANDLSKIKTGENYIIAFEAGNTIISIYSDINTVSSNNYLITGNLADKLGINKKADSYITIETANDIATYSNTLKNNINKISINNINNQLDQNKILANAFINRIGLVNLQNFYNKSFQNVEFLNWILNNSAAMEEFLSGPNPEGPNIPEGQPAATYTDCLQVLSNIWNTYTSSHTGFNLKLAIAVALTNGSTIYSFPTGKPVGSPVQRYKIFETLNAENGMMPGFSDFNVSHLCYVVNTDIANNQIMEMRSIILQNHNGLLTASELENVAYTINYNTRNPHTGVSVFNGNFYGPNPTIKTVWYDGGVCGATGRMGEAAEQVFGIPAAQTPQPGHNAFIYYDSVNNTWQIGNDISGWSGTYDADMSGWSDIISPKDSKVASYTELYQAADNGTLKESDMYLYLAEGQSNYQSKLAAITKAIKIDKLNLGAWIKLADLYHSNPKISIAQYNETAKEIKSIFANYTLPMTNMIHYLYVGALQSSINIAEENIANQIATESSENNLQNAIKNGQAILADDNASKNEIFSAINKINIDTSKLTISHEALIDMIYSFKYMADESIYTNSSRELLKNSINSLEKVVENPDSTTNEIVNALKSVDVAKSKLSLNNKKFMILLNKAKILVNNNHYTEVSRNNLQIAIEEGENVLKNPGVSNILVNAVENSLNTAINDLKLIPVNNSVKKIQLQEKLNIDIEEANNVINNNGYTVSSRNSLITEIAKDQTILNNQQSTIDEISAAINTLERAYNNLVINKGELEHEIETANSLVNNSKYTSASRNALETTIKSAENIYNSKNSIATAVENAINELEQSINELKINKVTVKNNAEAVYFTTISGEKAIVINGNLQGAKNIAHSTEKQLVIENANGEIVSTINTVAVNWYSGNSKDYSGYQGIITGAVLSNLKFGESYKVGIKYNGAVELLNSTVSLPSNSQYDIKNDNGNVTIIRNNVSEPAVTNYEIAYEYNGGFIINGNVNLNGENISNKVEKELVITDSKGKVVYENNTVPVNWYSGNATNYSGFQAYIPKAELDKLANGDYKVSMVINDAGKKYSMNIEGHGVNVTSDGFNMTMKGNSLTLNKEESLSGTATIENKYADGENTVINAKMNLDSVPVGSEATMKVLENNGQINEVKGVLVDWYSNNKSNLNGAQFIMNTKDLENAKTVKVIVTVGNKEYNLILS